MKKEIYTSSPMSKSISDLTADIQRDIDNLKARIEDAKRIPPWLSLETEIPGASTESLKRTLLTMDGAGRKVKEAALNELIRRAGTGEVKVEKEIEEMPTATTLEPLPSPVTLSE